ncbi:MAG: tetratricopeptide repeat protein [Candidatus Cloacimonetes bacterium]|nr:tetratricopeptide repeat protein [Candidatus Cloacimonadota bacterium]MBS3766544.1 tetratricopeptide repeat protein [Candidatus Cloacimonadota bacterium]
MKKLILVSTIFMLIFNYANSYTRKQIIDMKNRQARYYIQRSQFDKAEKAYYEILETTPHHEETIKSLVDLYFSTKQYDKLKEILKKEETALSESYILLTKLQLQLKNNNMDEVENIIDDYLNFKKESSISYVKVAGVFNKEKYFEKAEEYYQKARNLAKNDKAFALNLAMVYKQLGENEKAIDEYLNLLDERKYSYVRYNLEKLEVKNEKIIEAIKQRIKSEENKNLRKLLAEFYFIDENFEEAAKIYKFMGRRELIQFANKCQRQGYLEPSIKAYMDVLAEYDISFVSKIKINKRIGDLYFSGRDYENAEKLYKNVLQVYKDTDTERFNLDVLYSLEKLVQISFEINNEPQQARNYAEQAHKLSEKTNYALRSDNLLAKYELYADDYEKSREMFKQIIDKSEERHKEDIYTEAKYYLYLTNLLSGKYKAADSLFQNYIRYDYKSEYFNDIVSAKEMAEAFKLSETKDSLAILLKDFIKHYNSVNVTITKNVYDKIKNQTADSLKLNYLNYVMGIFYYKHNMYDKAIKLYENVKDYGEIVNWEILLKNLGYCYLNKQNYKTAKRIFKNYLTSYSNGAYAPQIRNELTKIDRI